MCREILEYRAKQIPGTVFVGDSTDSELFAAFNIQVEFNAGSSAVCIVLIPPPEQDLQQIWTNVYGEVLVHVHGRIVAEPFISLIETNQVYCEIENVIDMRLPATQAWIHEQFTRANALPYYAKQTATRPQFFFGMLPSLMHFEYGGTALTHGIGSWPVSYTHLTLPTIYSV